MLKPMAGIGEKASGCNRIRVITFPAVEDIFGHS